MNRKIRTKEQGFTLIEIIAVLIILGILAAVAVPKFMDMQEDAQLKAKQGACAAAASQISLVFSKSLLQNGGDVSAALTNATTNLSDKDLGDFDISSVETVDTSDATINVELTLPSGFNLAEKNCTIPNPGYQGTASKG
jgi:prepilin-type N-terminal cleavage/methylation domain-containing protein